MVAISTPVAHYGRIGTVSARRSSARGPAAAAVLPAGHRRTAATKSFSRPSSSRTRHAAPGRLICRVEKVPDIPVEAVARLSRSLVPGQEVHSCVLDVGGSQIKLETGEIGRQANGAVTASAGDTVIFTTACADPGRPGDGSFLPLQIQYMERFSAAGKTSGGFIKRDGRQKEGEVLTSRLVDRPLRPMFAEGWTMETQVLQWVYSFDGKNSPEPLAITAAGAALAISDIPLKKPVAAVRVGLVAGEFIVNPSIQQQQISSLDLVIAGTEDAVLMIEGFCDFLSEDEMLESIQVGADAISGMCKKIQAWADKVGKPKSTELVLMPDNLNVEVEAMVKEDLDKAFRISKKQERGEAVDAVKARIMAALSEDEDGPQHPAVHVSKAFKNACSKAVRSMVLKEKIRTDGRGLKDVRPIASRAGVLPVPHGTALFTRGETQVLAVATIGSDKMAQRVDTLQTDAEDEAEFNKRFYLQYFFPPSSVGEVGRCGPASRRETGHGQLAERALAPIVPSNQDFPYTLRIEANCTESNGSSSMASVCGGCLSMMDAGVPVKAVVAGVAMGLVLEEDGSFVVLTDILGTEDALGDMDFKVAGSEDGVTAFQMDIKVEGITIPIMKQALEQAKEGRRHILREMKLCNPPPADQLPASVPRIHKTRVPAEKIGALIGKAGSTIKGITETSGAEVNVDKDGAVTISAPDDLALQCAIELVQKSVAEVEVGKVYRNCKVTGVATFGCFVEVLPGKDGLVHIGELALKKVKEVSDVVAEGDLIDVLVLGVQDNGKISLSRKALLKDKETAGR